VSIFDDFLLDPFFDFWFFDTAIAIPLGGSEQEFQTAVERLAKAHPDASVEGKNVQFPNGWYRSVRIEKKG